MAHRGRASRVKGKRAVRRTLRTALDAATPSLGNGQGDAQNGGTHPPPKAAMSALKMGARMLRRNGGNASKIARSKATMSMPGKPTWAEAAVDVRSSAPSTPTRTAGMTSIRRVMDETYDDGLRPVCERMPPGAHRGIRRSIRSNRLAGSDWALNPATST